MAKASAGKGAAVRYRAVRTRRSDVREPTVKTLTRGGGGAAVSAHTGLTRADVASLVRGGVDAKSFATVRPAVRPAAERYQVLLRDSLTVEQAAKLLGVDSSRIRQRLAAATLYGIKVAGEWRLPAFQFRPQGGLVPGIECVTRVLAKDLNPVAFWGWLTTPNVDLVSRQGVEEPLTPLEWLETGHSPDVAAALAAEL